MNLPCLFASSDVLYREEMHLASCFSTLAVKKKQSSGSVKSWPSVGETWIDGRLFHGFCTVYFSFFAIQSCTQFPLYLSPKSCFHHIFRKLQNFRLFEHFTSSEYTNGHCAFWFYGDLFLQVKGWRNLLNEVWKKGRIICRAKDFNTQLADLFDLVSFTSNALSQCAAQHQLPNVHHNPVHTCTNAPDSQW